MAYSNKATLLCKSYDGLAYTVSTDDWAGGVEIRLYDNLGSADEWGDDYLQTKLVYSYDQMVIFSGLAKNTEYYAAGKRTGGVNVSEATTTSGATFVIQNVVPGDSVVSFEIYADVNYSGDVPLYIYDRYTLEKVWTGSLSSPSEGNTYSLTATGLTPPSKIDNTKGNYLISIADSYDFAVFNTATFGESYGTPWGATAWGGITVEQEVAERVDITGNVMVARTLSKSISGAVRVARNTTSAITGTVRVQKASEQTITGAVRVEKPYNTTITGMARITATDVENITGATRIAKNATQSIAGAVDVNADNVVEIVGAVMVSGARGVTISGTTNIDNPNQRVSERTITGAVDILGTNNTEISGNAMVAKPFDTSIDGVVHIENARYDAVDGIVCVEASSEARVDGVVRIARDESTDITGTVQVIGVNSDSIDGSVKVERAQTATLDGLVQILKTRDVDLTGKVRIRVVTPEKLPETWGKYKEPLPLEWEKREKDSQGWREKDDTGDEPETWHYPLNDSK